MESLLILGRQPAIGLSEIESLYGSKSIKKAGDQAAVLSVDPCILAFDRLGGSTKFAKVLTTLETTKWSEIEKFLIDVSPKHSSVMSKGKLQLGLSLYGFNETIQRITATGLNIKKAIKKTGRSVRYIQNKNADLNSAQVKHNHLTGEHGWELLFVKDGSKTIIGQTIKVQDIESYTLRDRKRPYRDAKVGMLPPKLAQIIINLAVGLVPESELQSICDIPAGEPIPRPILNKKILDPFCGTGVILQEALLMGYGIYGTDLEERMVSYSQKNIHWLAEKYPVTEDDSHFDKADACSFTWTQDFDYIATETYLGRPFTSKPNTAILKQTVADCQLILRKFLLNSAKQLKSGDRLCVAIPAWQLNQNQFQHLPLIDQLDDLGYTRIRFEHAGNDDLIYYRPDQIVARQLIVITRN